MFPVCRLLFDTSSYSLRWRGVSGKSDVGAGNFGGGEYEGGKGLGAAKLGTSWDGAQGTYVLHLIRGDTWPSGKERVREVWVRIFTLLTCTGGEVEAAHRSLSGDNRDGAGAPWIRGEYLVDADE